MAEAAQQSARTFLSGHKADLATGWAVTTSLAQLSDKAGDPTTRREDGAEVEERSGDRQGYLRAGRLESDRWMPLGMTHE